MNTLLFNLSYIYINFFKIAYISFKFNKYVNKYNIIVLFNLLNFATKSIFPLIRFRTM